MDETFDLTGAEEHHRDRHDGDKPAETDVFDVVSSRSLQHESDKPMSNIA